jgi:tellurite resistance protein
MEFFPEIAITEGEAELIAHGLLAVARADGALHDRELALVSSFYGEVVGGSGSHLAALANEAEVAPDVLAAGLGRDQVAMLFVKTSILLAYADGQYGDREKAKITSFAHALEIGDAALAELEQSVKEYLLGHLSGLKNREAAVEVAKKLAV